MEERKEKTNVIIAENTLSYAENLASAINQTDDFIVTDMVDNGKALMQKLNGLKKGIILLDIHMPPYTTGLCLLKKYTGVIPINSRSFFFQSYGLIK